MDGGSTSVLCGHNTNFPPHIHIFLACVLCDCCVKEGKKGGRRGGRVVLEVNSDFEGEKYRSHTHQRTRVGVGLRQTRLRTKESVLLFTDLGLHYM